MAWHQHESVLSFLLSTAGSWFASGCLRTRRRSHCCSSATARNLQPYNRRGCRQARSVPPDLGGLANAFRKCASSRKQLGAPFLHSYLQSTPTTVSASFQGIAQLSAWMRYACLQPTRERNTDGSLLFPCIAGACGGSGVTPPTRRPSRELNQCQRGSVCRTYFLLGSIVEEGKQAAVAADVYEGQDGFAHGNNPD